MKQLFHISEVEGKESIQPVLSIRLGEKHFCFSISDFISNELKQLAYYTTDEINDIFLQELFTATPVLNGPFYQVLVCYDYSQSSLISTRDYKHEDTNLLLNTMYGLNGTATIISEPVAEWQLYNVYAVPKNVHEWITKKFAAVKYCHQYTINIKNLNPTIESSNLLVDLRKDDFTILVMDNNKLLLTQTIIYSTPDDILYYLLKICQQFGLSPQEVKIGLSGLVDQQSALYRELYQYFLHVEFRNVRWTIPASANTDSPLHFFTSLNDLSQCAS